MECPDEDRRLAADGIDDARPDDQRRDEPESLLVEVREGQDGEKALLGTEVQHLRHGLRDGKEAAMRDHRALRFAGCPAREDDLGEVVGRDRQRLDRLDVAGSVRQGLDEDDR